MKIISCKTNHITNPLGFYMPQVTFTWKVADTQDKKQRKARVKVWKNEESDLVFDSGESSQLSSLGVRLPEEIQLLPRTRYYWNVQVWGETETAVSEINWFETGKRDEAWTARWIAPACEDKKVHPYLKTQIQMPETKKVKEARAYICGLGLFELEINGKKVGEEFLTPYSTTGDEWMQYLTFDIGEQLSSGRNEIGVVLANGWYKGRFGTFGEMFQKPYVYEFMLLCEIHITYEDGTEEVYGTDDTWKWAKSKVVDDGIYDGEIYDDTITLTDWNDTVCVEQTPTKVLLERMSLPVVVKEEIKPIEIIHTPAGETVLDLGQNFSGVLKFSTGKMAEKTVTLSFGEILQNGNFYRDNLRTAKAQYVYTTDGIEKEVYPHFTYYGFRYVKLEGFAEDISTEDFTGLVLYSDLEDTGMVETSNPELNRLFLNAKWGQKSNFLDVPTDCPQRDERMGWTGDTQVFSETATYNMDTYAFYQKQMHDIAVDQSTKNGMVGNVVPLFMEQQENNMPFYGGSAAWGDCAVIVPWNMYLQYGDRAMLEAQYDSMKAWVDWVHQRTVLHGDTGLWTGDYQWGDWLALDGPVEGGTQGGTDNDFVASAYYCYSAEILGKTAAILGNTEDAAYYTQLSERTRNAIQDEYFSKNGKSTIRTQTAHVLALAFELIPESVRSRVASDLEQMLKENQYHLKTGFVGTPLLAPVLSEMGYSESAYHLLLQSDYPSWLFAVKMGATTIWERWNSVTPEGKISGTEMNSLNHYSYGAIAGWMYKYMGGIRRAKGDVGFKEIIIRPEPDKRLTAVCAGYDSPSGFIQSSWKRENSHMTFEVTIPFDVKATVYFPYSEEVKVLEAGTYSFEYEAEGDYRNVYSTRDFLKILKENPQTKTILSSMIPGIDQLPEDYAKPNLPLIDTLNSMVRMTMGDKVEELIGELDRQLGNIEK